MVDAHVSETHFVIQIARRVLGDGSVLRTRTTTTSNKPEQQQLGHASHQGEELQAILPPNQTNGCSPCDQAKRTANKPTTAVHTPLLGQECQPLKQTNRKHNNKARSNETGTAHSPRSRQARWQPCHTHPARRARCSHTSAGNNNHTTIRNEM